MTSVFKDNCVVKCPKRLVEKVFIDCKSTPNCKFLFSSCKLGKPLWKQAPTSDFTFYDPYNRESSVEYNPLRDPFLKHFFLRKANLIKLRKKNLITDENEVICGTKEFNDYRRVLHRLATERRAEQQKALAVDELDDHRVKLSNGVFEMMDNKQRKLMNTYDLEKFRYSSSNVLGHRNIVEIMKRKKFEQERVQMEKFKAKVENYNQRLCKIQQRECMRINLIKERAVYRTMDIENKRVFVQNKLKRFQIKTMMQMATQDKKIKETRAKKLQERAKTCCFVFKCPISV